MLKICIAVVCASFLSGVVLADSLEFVRATTFSLTSDGPVLHDTTAAPSNPSTTDDRITLSDTGKAWLVHRTKFLHQLTE